MRAALDQAPTDARRTGAVPEARAARRGRTAALLAVALSACALVACGVDDDQQIESVVTELGGALDRGDAADACRFAVERPRLMSGGELPCEEAVERIDASPTLDVTPIDATVEPQVEIDGDRATACFGTEGAQDQRYELIRRDERWAVTVLPSSGPC